MPINITVLNKWAEALESGDYEQGFGLLCRAKDSTYCCLGVAAKVILEPSQCAELFESDVNSANPVDRPGSFKWLTDATGLTPFELNVLTQRNDSCWSGFGWTFLEIARHLRNRVQDEECKNAQE